MIRVLATIDLQPGTRDKFLAIFGRLVPKVLAEAGCVDYAPFVDLPTSLAIQLPQRPDTVTIVEQWTDLGALQSHLAAPHMAEYRQEVQDMVRQVTLQVIQPAA